MKLEYYPVRLSNDRLVFLVNIATGWGEIAPLQMDSNIYQSIELELQQCRYILEPIVNLSLSEIGDCIANMSCNNSVKCGIEQALLHHLANQQHKALAELLCCSGQPTRDVEINALVPRVTAAEAEKMTKQLLDRSFVAIKVKVGSPDIQADLDRVQAVRQTAGKDISLHLDANSAWTAEQAIRNLELLAEFDISYIEQPVKTIAELAQIKGKSKIPIAIDEAVSCSDDLYKAIEYNCCDIVVIKPMLWGGLLAAQRGIEIAKQHKLVVVLTGTLEGTIGRWGVYELARANHIDRACGLTGYDYLKLSVADKVIGIPAKLWQ
ncbi:MAG: mandelate racemase/muconate lactonizing enzyme family protein [Pseudanabaenaceae cyanobacterium]